MGEVDFVVVRLVLISFLLIFLVLFFSWILNGFEKFKNVVLSFFLEVRFLKDIVVWFD